MTDIKKVEFSNKTSKPLLVRAVGGMETVAPNTARICEVSEKELKAAQERGLKSKAVDKDAKLGYVGAPNDTTAQEAAAAVKPKKAAKAD